MFDHCCYFLHSTSWAPDSNDTMPKYHAQIESCLPSNNASFPHIPRHSSKPILEIGNHHLHSPSIPRSVAPSMKVTPSGTLAGKPPDKSSSARTVIPRSRQCLQEHQRKGGGLREPNRCIRYAKTPFNHHFQNKRIPNPTKNFLSLDVLSGPPSAHWPIRATAWPHGSQWSPLHRSPAQSCRAPKPLPDRLHRCWKVLDLLAIS